MKAKEFSERSLRTFEFFFSAGFCTPIFLKLFMAGCGDQATAAAVYLLFYSDDDEQGRQQRRWWVGPQCSSRHEEGETRTESCLLVKIGPKLSLILDFRGLPKLLLSTGLSFVKKYIKHNYYIYNIANRPKT